MYVEFHPASGFLFVREYHLSTLEQDSGAIAAQAAEIAGLVQSRSYCGRRYAFAEFTSMEEKLYHERGFVTVECSLLSRERNLGKLMADAFGHVLNRPVRVTVDSAEISLFHRGLDVQVRGNNALGVYAKDDQQQIVWRNGTLSFEVVLGDADREASSFRSLEPYVGADVSSPEVSKEAIDAWRRAEP
jgi:hypothetical protein